MWVITVQDAEPGAISLQGNLPAAGIRPSRSVHVQETYCLMCDKSGAFPIRVVGRWDHERQATAIPFEPVAVFMSCGCIAGDPSLAEPTDRRMTDD